MIKAIKSSVTLSNGDKSVHDFETGENYVIKGSSRGSESEKPSDAFFEPSNGKILHFEPQKEHTEQIDEDLMNKPAADLPNTEFEVAPLPALNDGFLNSAGSSFLENIGSPSTVSDLPHPDKTLDLPQEDSFSGGSGPAPDDETTEEEGLKNTKSLTKAKMVHRNKTYDRCELVLPKGTKAVIKSIIDVKGVSFNSYVYAALKEKIQRDTGLDLNTLKEPADDIENIDE